MVIIVKGVAIVIVAVVLASIGEAVTVVMTITAGRNGLEFQGVRWLMKIYIDFHC